ncbi:MAG: hypothetical protein HYV28_10465 [Ignavibacteriales bacterium]|nr:hypothetical protein [Ignavibacteriales bacterium]
MRENTFKEAVESTPEVKNCYQAGLKALGKYSNKIQVKDNGKCDGSLDIDKCTMVKYPQAPRWDYAIGYDGKVVFVEVHSANTSEVSKMFDKLDWLKWWLTNNAPAINKLKKFNPAFVWIQSNGFAILKHSAQYRRVAQINLLPVNKLNLL